MLYLLITWLTVGIIWELIGIVELALSGERMEKDEKLAFIVGSILTILAGPIAIPYSMWLVKHNK